MIPEISKVKGIHPGAILRREIKGLGLKNKEFAALINEHAQTISAVLNEKRSINPNLSVKLGTKLGIDNDYFMLLQASYDVKIVQDKLSQPQTPDLKTIRKALFWDTDFNKIDWIKSKRAIIKRVFERGNENEIGEILKFYGKHTVNKELENISNNFLPSFKSNVNKYIGV
ncbi:MAG: HigA family addiction module antidote protein [Bacteroidales bacterium]|nr:HigA family addiction module antidote protein [Bacteroidales bacterium]